MSGRINLEEAKRIFTPTGAAEPDNIKRYKAAVKAYADHRQTLYTHAERANRNRHPTEGSTPDVNERRNRY